MALVDGKNWAAISRAGKLNSTYLRDILERNQTPQLKSAEKLSEGLGVPLTDWFVEGAPQEPVIRLENLPRDVPVYGTGSCGDDGAFDFNEGTPIDFVRRPDRLSGVKDAYAIYVVGNSMSPWREEGQLVYVHSKQPAKVGDYVVVQTKPMRQGEAPRAHIKRLEKRTASDLVLSQYNPPKKITIPLSKVVSIHRIMDWGELLGV